MEKTLRGKYIYLTASFVAAALITTLDARHLKMAPQADPLNFYTGIFEDIHLPVEGECYGTVAAKAEYRRSFRGERITNFLFDGAMTPDNALPSSSSPFCTTRCSGNCSGKLLVQGSRVANRSTTSLLADYFGLPTDFSSEVTFCPRVEQAIVDLSTWWGLDGWWCGGWAFVRTPIVWQRTNLNAVEKIIDPGTNGYDPGYFTATGVDRDDLLNSFGEFTSGKAPTLGAGTTFDALKYERFTTSIVSAPLSNGELPTAQPACNGKPFNKTGLADIHFGIGWDFCRDSEYNYHAGVGLLLVAPTGTRVDNVNLFTPQIGNNRHFELGALWTSHYLLWRGCDDNSYLNFHLEAQVSHLFKSCELHTFGICNPMANCKTNALSHYMLAMQFGNNDVNTPTQGSTTPAPQPYAVTLVVPATTAEAVFDNHYAPVANLTTRALDASVKAQGYVLAALNYHCDTIDAELGYQFYGRTGENFNHASNNASYFNTNIPGAWALKGDAAVYGFEITDLSGGQYIATTPIPLSATQSRACITGGLNFTPGGDFSGESATSFIAIETARANPNIDHPQFAYVLREGFQRIVVSLPGSSSNPPSPLGPRQTMTSIQPAYLTDANVIGNEGSKERTHTIFGSINRRWECFDSWEPGIGIGARVDFSGKRSCGRAALICGAFSSSCGLNAGCTNSGNSDHAGVAQWGVWLKFTASFA